MRKKRKYKVVPCGLRKIESMDYGTDYDCDYACGSDCSECICNGGDIDPRTDKRAPEPLRKMMSQHARQQYAKPADNKGSV